MMIDDEKLKQLGIDTITTEARSIEQLIPRMGLQFIKACHLLLACKGRIIVMGMGKSGHIGNKIAATLASTGSPAFFVHPAEAGHGDLGMITEQDVVLSLSNSGETEEIINLLPTLKLLGIPIIVLTGHPRSTLAKEAAVYLDVSVEREACPLQLAPTSSTTAALVMGDALAIALLHAKGFTSHDFARSHPGGTLGKRLLLRVKDLMHTGHAIPIIHEQDSLDKALQEMTEKKLGHALIVDAQNHLKGIYTDGDVRRTLRKGCDIHRTLIAEVMTPHCRAITESILATEALRMMEDKKITALPVVDEAQRVIGILHIHDVLRAGMVI